MFGIDDALIAGVVSAGAGMIAGAGNQQVSRENTAANIAYNREALASQQAFGREMSGAQMDFQERMSSTAYQRSREDMVKAGLNPILAAGAGGASTPSGSTASISPLPFNSAKRSGLENLGGTIDSAIGSATRVALAEKTVDKLVQEVATGKAEEALKKSQRISTDVDPEVKRASIQKTLAAAALDAAQTEESRQRQAIKKPEQEMRSSTAGSLTGKAGLFGKDIAAAISPLNIINSARNYFRR